MTEEHQPKKVYLSGVAAPSVVAAFLSGSLFPPPLSPPRPPSPSPVLSLFLSTPLFAQSKDGQPGPESHPGLTIEEVDFSSAGRSITDGLRASIVGQRPPSRRQYLYVLGTTTDEARAKNIAKKLIQDLAQVYEEQDAPRVHLLKTAGSDKIFLSIGHLHATALEAETLRGSVMLEFLGAGEGHDTNYKSSTERRCSGRTGIECTRSAIIFLNSAVPADPTPKASQKTRVL